MGDVVEFNYLKLRYDAHQYVYDWVFYGEETAVLRYNKKQTPSFKREVIAELRRWGLPETGPVGPSYPV